jgi:hemerythrin-like domain-containing protein
MDDLGRDRRGFLAGAAGTGLVLIAGGAHAAKPADGKKQPAKEKEKGGDIPPTEDLMREHGVLRRVLLVYDEAARRLTGEDTGAIAVVSAAANIVHRFVEGYHEKLEEDFVFPKLEKAGKLADLTRILRVQHAAGRKLTDAILKSAKAGKAATAEQRRALVADLQSFGRMYAPHAAWEDTELFPAYREQFTEAELDKLGDQFEDQEHKLLGSGGFEGSLKEVADLEKALGVHNLAKFTPA